MKANQGTDSPSVQGLIDALSIALGRPVLLDDPALAPIAFSRQWDVDDVRSESILRRGVQSQVKEALLAQGIGTARDVVHTAADPDLGMEGRVCLPIRERGTVLGYLWLLDPQADLTEHEFVQLRKAAREIAARLGSSPHLGVPDNAMLLAGLCSADPAVRERSVEEAQADGFLHEEHVTLCRFASITGSDLESLEAARKVVHRLSVGSALAATVPEGAALVVSVGDPVLRMIPADEIGIWVHAVVGPEILVGQSSVGSIRTLDNAQRQATIALRIARAYPKDGAKMWSDLGADRLVAQLPAGIATDLPERVAHFISAEPRLARTLSTFLDAAGDVKATAAALSLGRSGLYYRLRRIREITGLDLDDGDDRLLAHLAIRLARYGGKSQ